jgi:hypothetical protein
VILSPCSPARIRARIIAARSLFRREARRRCSQRRHGRPSPLVSSGHSRSPASPFQIAHERAIRCSREMPEDHRRRRRRSALFRPSPVERVVPRDARHRQLPNAARIGRNGPLCAKPGLAGVARRRAASPEHSGGRRPAGADVALRAPSPSHCHWDPLGPVDRVSAAPPTDMWAPWDI